MKNYKFLTLLLFLNLSCVSYKNQLISRGDYNDAIKNAILDYSNTNQFKNGVVFYVHVDYPDDTIILVRILEDYDNKFLYSKLKTVEENKLPNRHYELNNKLFIWYDNTFESSEETFNQLKKYNMLIDDKGGLIVFLDPIIDEKKTGTKYFFCKNDLKIYKRITTNRGVIPVPKIKCN